ncbi:SMODS-associated and fused to various effectors domain-containing protein [Candidatus Magnetomoraceae bacterium gMMP-15]
MNNGNSKVNKALERLNASLVNTIIFFIGILSVLATFFVTSNDCKNIFISVGCSLIASSVVSYLTSKYLIRVNRIKKIIQYWGLEAIFETRQEMNRSTDIAFESLENKLDIIAWGLKSFRDAKDKIVRAKVERGLKIRIIAPDPDSEYVKQRERDEKEIEGQIKQTIINLETWLEELRQISPDPANIRIKYYSRLPEDFYFRVDEHIFVGPYLYGISSQQTISYEFKGRSHGFTYYKDYFEKLWNDNEFCKERLNNNIH